GVRGGVVTGRDEIHASVTGPCGRAAPDTRSVTKTPGTSRFPALRPPNSRGPGRAVDFDPPIGGSNPGHVFVTSEEDGRKGHVPGASVTRPDIGDGSVALPSSSRDLPPLPAPPAVSATATACPGRGRDGRVPCRPFPGRRVPRPSLPRAPRPSAVPPPGAGSPGPIRSLPGHPLPGGILSPARRSVESTR